MGERHCCNCYYILNETGKNELTTGKRSVRRPSTRWTDDVVKTAKSRWLQVASDRSCWKSIEEAMFSSGQLQAGMMMIEQLLFFDDGF